MHNYVLVEKYNFPWTSKMGGGLVCVYKGQGFKDYRGKGRVNTPINKFKIPIKKSTNIFLLYCAH